MNKFLHLILDEKFIDEAMVRFEKTNPGKHDFLFIEHPERHTTFKYLKDTRHVTTVQYLSQAYFEYISKLDEYTAVFLHSLINRYFVDFLIRADKNTVFIWLYWGAELWTLNKFKMKAFLPATKLLYYKHRFDIHAQKVRIIFNKYRQMIFKCGITNTAKVILNKRTEGNSIYQISDSDVIKAMRRANYIIPVVDEDYYNLKSLIHCHADMLDWNYSPGLPFNELDKVSISGNDLLVGNSGHYTNNHLDIFFKLRRHQHLFDNIVTPLSYGDPYCIHSILSFGNRIFKKRFSPMVSYMPVKDYFTIISKCRIAVFNSRRQQAVGNIVMCLYMGMKVFLRNENPVYSYLIKNKVICFSIQEDFRRKILINNLSSEQKENNRNIISELFGNERLLKKTEELIQTLKGAKTDFKPS
jgi:hypothetical protein